MTALSVVFLLLALLTWRWMLLTLRKSPVELRPAEPRADLKDVVSLIVPMRNEESHVDSCLSAIRAQTHARLQVIVVDDASTDSTPQLLERWKQQWPELEVVRLESCPAGWAGKVHAMHRGVERARGEWLFFTDADVELAPDAIARGLATAVERNWSVLSVVGRLVTASFWEVAIQLPFSAFFLWAMVESPQTTLCGHYILMRRSLFDKVGGFAAIPGAVADDREMARLLRVHAIPFRAHLWTEAYRSRMFTSAWGIWPGIRRMIAGTARFRAARVLGVALWILLADLLPFAALAYGIASYPQGGRRPLFWILSAAALILARWTVYQRLLARLRAPRAAFLIKPLGDLLSFLLYLDAALYSLTGSVKWKDRAYSRSSLSRAAEAAVAAPEAPPAPQPGPASPPGAYKMSVVVEMDTSGYWHEHGIECDKAMAQFFRIAREHPEVEILFVSDRPLELAEPGLPNLRVLASPSHDYYAMKRYGFQQARSGIIAFCDSDCIYPRDYVPQLLAGFEDPQTQVVAAKIRYAPRCAKLKAASMRDWGHLSDDPHAMAHFAATAFAARRELLERHHFGLGFRRVGAELLLYFLCRMEGAAIRYLPGVTAFHQDYYQSLATARYRLFRDFPPSVDVARRIAASLGFHSFKARAFLRMLPLQISLRRTLASARRYPRLRDGLRVRGWERISVPLWLLVFAGMSLGLALRAVLQPRWFHRKGEEERLTLSPALDEDPNHPVNLALNRLAAWVREDPSRLKRLFDTDRQDPPDPESGRKGAAEAGASAATEAVPTPPQGQPSPPAGSFRLSVVVEMANAVYWKQHGEESKEAVEQFCRMAREHAEVEVLFITDGPMKLGDPGLPNVRSLASPDPTYFAMKRLGMLQARSGLIAFADSDCLYPPDYVEQLLTAFADPKVQIVAGKTRYPVRGARTKAANIRDWGHLPDQGPAPLYVAANNLAARRQVLEKYQFGWGFQRVAGELMLCVLARMDGISIHYLPHLLARHHDFREALGPSWYKALMDYPASVDLARRALTRLKVSPLRAAGFLRLMPLRIWWMMTRASARSYGQMRRELDIRGFQRVTVPLWLAAFCAQNGWLALRGLLQPGWLLRKGRELRFTLSPELDQDASHPLNLAIDRTVAWVRQDRSRVTRLFVPEDTAPSSAPSAR